VQCRRIVEHRVRRLRRELADVDERLVDFKDRSDSFGVERAAEWRAKRESLVAKLVAAGSAPYGRPSRP
jgi:hypothetical protein